MRTSKAPLSWLFKMAWRDSRKNWNRLFLFTSSIILGIAALVAIQSFGDNLKGDIEGQAKELLGADVLIEGRQKPDSTIQHLLDSIAGISKAKAEEISFASMVYHPKSKSTRLANIRALSGGFPFYGDLETLPLIAGKNFRSKQAAIIDQTLLLQFDAKAGEVMRVGKVSFNIEGELLQAPGQNNIVSTVAPKVYIPMQYLAQTGLVKAGSRLQYRYYYRLDEGIDPERLDENLSQRLRKAEYSLRTVEDSKRNLGNAFDALTRFLNLVAFIALLLGCVGVASAVNVYLKEKMGTVAVLRCLGAEGRHAFRIFLIQIAAIGLAGSLIGALLGSSIQAFLPFVLADFLPVEVNYSISWQAIGQGVALGVVVSVLFALLPLLRVRSISPLFTLRASFEEKKFRLDVYQVFAYSLILGFIYLFAYAQIKSWREAGYFTVFILFSLAVLSGVSRLLMWAVRRFFPVSWNYLWRQSIANLYRPNNQTATLILTIGLGTGLISTLYLIQTTLLTQVAISDNNNQPNLILFDIQTEQRESVRTVVKEMGLPIQQELPIVAMRLASYKGKSRQAWLDDSTNTLPRDVLNREYRISYRDTLDINEKLVEGKLGKAVTSPKDTIWVSISDTHASRMEAKIGDMIVFNVQGMPIKTYIGSIRKLDFTQFRTSFTFVFPSGVLEEAPQFFVLITRAKDKAQSAEVQKTLVQRYPNVSAVDIALVIESVQEVLDKVSFVIQFMALFSIMTGILVLLASVRISKYQRTQESVLLRTLGASRNQIFWINALEYFFLGSLASLTGIGLSVLASWALTVYLFELDFNPDLMPLLAVFAFITGITVLIGLLNSRGVVNKPPLEVLRA